MDPRLQLRIQRYGWDKAESFYERGWKQSLKPGQELLLQMAALKEGQKVLDISCGTGIISFEAARYIGPTGSIIGVDISDKMVNSSTQSATSLGLDRASFMQMEAEQLTLDDNEFNVALNAFGLMYYPNPKKALDQMYRVIIHGGRAVSAVWGARKRCGWAQIFPIVDARVKTEVCPLFFQLGTGDALAQLYKATGFANVKSKHILTKLFYRTEEDALNAVFAGGPVAMAYSRFDEQTKQNAHSEYIQSIEKYKNEEGYFIPGEFVVVSGDKEALMH